MSKVDTYPMEDTWLIQRLKRPLGDDNLSKLQGSFSFGGGYKNGGLSDDAMNLVSKICSFDYMGAAEFEFGALPEALQKIVEIAKEGHLELWSVKAGQYTRRDVTIEQERDPYLNFVADWDEVLSEEEIFVIGDARHQEEISRRICELAQHECTIVTRDYGERKSYPRGLKDFTRITHALKQRLNDADINDIRVTGWFELDNGYIFGLDPDMIKGFADLFGIESDKRHVLFSQTKYV